MRQVFVMLSKKKVIFVINMQSLSLTTSGICKKKKNQNLSLQPYAGFCDNHYRKLAIFGQQSTVNQKKAETFTARNTVCFKNINYGNSIMFARNVKFMLGKFA